MGKCATRIVVGLIALLAVFAVLVVARTAVVTLANVAGAKTATVAILSVILLLRRWLERQTYGVLRDPQIELPEGVVLGGPPGHFKLEDSDVKRFQADGIVCVKRAFAPWVDFLRKALKDQLDNPDFVQRQFQRGRRSYKCECPLAFHKNTAFQKFFQYSPIGHITSQVADTTEVRYYTDFMCADPLPTAQTAYWHIDNKGAATTDLADSVRFIIPLDDVRKENGGATEFLRRSHKLRLPQFRSSAKGGEHSVNRGESIHYDVKDDNPYVTSWDAKAGDVYIFDARTVHRLAPHLMGQYNRRCFSGTLLRAGARFYKLHPENLGFTRVGLKEGDVVQGARFPKVWPSRIEEETAACASGETAKVSWLGVVQFCQNLMFKPRREHCECPFHDLHDLGWSDVIDKVRADAQAAV